jgi:hypothetical protein
MTARSMLVFHKETERRRVGLRSMAALWRAVKPYLLGALGKALALPLVIYPKRVTIGLGACGQLPGRR